MQTAPSPTRLTGLFGLRRDRPLPLWLLFPPTFAAVYLSHLTLLRLPYYWDEAGYYIPAAWDFFRTGSLIPFTTLSNAHPPLPSIYLALWWKLGGMVPLVTRTAVCFVAALALLGVYRLSLVVTARISVAAVTTVLTAIYPVWFAQSTLAHADIFAAAATIWALSFVLESGPGTEEKFRNYRIAALLFSVAALCKETSIAIPLALAIYEIGTGPLLPGSPKSATDKTVTPKIWLLLAPVLPLALWYTWHWHKTGFIFGNPEFLRYNATATLTPLRILVAFCHRVIHITAYMNLFVPVLCMIAAMLLPPLPERSGDPRERVPFSVQGRFYLIIVVDLLLFSLMLLLCVNTWRRRIRHWPAIAVLTSVAFFAGLELNPPYRFAPEDNLAYATVIRLHQQAIGEIMQRYPHASVLTAWPATDELSKPELGYVLKPVPVVKVEDFSLAEIQRAAQLAGQSDAPYTFAFPFSTKYDPPNLLFNLGPGSEELDTKYFGFHHDLPPEAIARLLGGEVIWQADRKGQWAAVLHFDRPQLAESSTKNRLLEPIRLKTGGSRL
jgi:hypothetical protein